MSIIWTIDGDESSWSAWAQGMAEAGPSPLMEQILEDQQVSSPALAVDLGCGTGRAFTPLTHNGFKVIGLDPTFLAVRLSHSRVATDRLAAWSVCAEAGHIPLVNNCAVLVFAVGVLFHLSQHEQSAALEEIRRILQPDGKAILHFLDIDDWRKTLAREVYPDLLPSISYCSVITCFCSREDILDWIYAADLKIESLTLYNQVTERGEQRNWIAICRL
jgi:SAM-dependent methyltransferase